MRLNRNDYKKEPASTKIGGFIIFKLTYHQRASPQMASKIDYHEPQHNLLPQQNNPILDWVLLYSPKHILEQVFQTIQDAKEKTFVSRQWDRRTQCWMKDKCFKFFSTFCLNWTPKLDNDPLNVLHNNFVTIHWIRKQKQPFQGRYLQVSSFKISHSLSGKWLACKPIFR